MMESLTPYWSVTGRVLLSITMIIIMVMALFGNTLVIVVIAKNKGMRTRTNMFLFNLAVTDLFCALLDMPFSLITVIRGEWIFGGLVGEPGVNSTQSVANVCYFNGFATYFFWVASIHTLMYIAVFKYATIRNPFSASLNERLISVLIAASWIWAAVIGYFSIHGLTTVYFQHYSTQCGPLYNKSDKWTYVHFWVIMISCYIIPLLIIVICYVLMFREILAHGQRMSHNSDVGTDQIYIRQKRIAITLVLMLVTFIVCWTPWLGFTIYDLIHVQEGIANDNIVPYANPITFWFGYANSACNPIIYALRSDAFREGFKQTLVRNVTTTGYDIATQDAKKGIHRRDTLHPLHAETSFNEKDVRNIYYGKDYESNLRRTSTNSTYAYSDSPNYLQESFRSNATPSPSAWSQGDDKRTLHPAAGKNQAAFNFPAVSPIVEGDEKEEPSEFKVTAVRPKKKKRPQKPVQFDGDTSGSSVVAEPLMLQAAVPAMLRPHGAGAMKKTEPPRVLSKIEDADEDRVSPPASGNSHHSHEPRKGSATKRNGARSTMVRYPSVEVLDHHTDHHHTDRHNTDHHHQREHLTGVAAMHGNELHVLKGQHSEVF